MKQLLAQLFFIGLMLMPLQAIEGSKPAVPGYKTVVDTARLIIEHHLQPPAPQDIALKAAQTYLQNAGHPSQNDLVKQSWDITSFATMEEFFQRLEQKFPDKRSGAWATTRNQLAKQYSNVKFTLTREAKVQESLKSNQYVGIGIMMTVKKYPAMGKVMENGSAYAAGCRDGDVMIEIDGQSTKDWTGRKSLDALRGKKGTQVSLTLKRGDRVFNKLITRNTVPFKTVRLSFAEDGKYAMLSFTSVGSSTVSELRKLEAKILAENYRGVILNLNNGGQTRIHDAVLLANALMDGGKIGSQKSKLGNRDYQAEPERLFGSLPIALITSPENHAVHWAAMAASQSENVYTVATSLSKLLMINRNYPIPNTEWSISLPHSQLIPALVDPAKSKSVFTSQRADPRRLALKILKSGGKI